MPNLKNKRVLVSLIFLIFMLLTNITIAQRYDIRFKRTLLQNVEINTVKNDSLVINLTEYDLIVKLQVSDIHTVHFIGGKKSGIKGLIIGVVIGGMFGIVISLVLKGGFNTAIPSKFLLISLVIAFAIIGGGVGLLISGVPELEAIYELYHMSTEEKIKTIQEIIAKHKK
ncbi:hypothetical protein H8E88_02645 [candidate division KSB1 bacterium]|nr:hypothetical protein [candidate division KSB1 bacterium]